MTSIVICSKSALETSICDNFSVLIEVLLGCEGIQVLRPRHWEKSQVQNMPHCHRKRQICILAPGKSVPTVVSSPCGQQQFRLIAPRWASTQSQMLAPPFVVPRALCCAPQPPPDPSAGTQLCLAMHGGLLSHRASTGSGHCRSFESWPYMWALKGCFQGLFYLHYRSTLKAFTSVLNGHVYLSPPVANTNTQAIFHLFVEL